MKGRPIFKTPDKYHILSAPPFIQLELSTGCTQKCRHCYNFWRRGNFKPENLSKEKLDFLIEEFKKSRVMHVVLTGGEPFINFDILLYAIKNLTNNGISVSVNSNLTLATPEKMKKLREAGLPHILTSLDASNAELNDYITSTPGSFDQIVKGIKTTLEAGIRVSINMVILKNNIGDIYATAKLANDLGCQRFNTTRTIPVLDAKLPSQKNFIINKKDAQKILDETLRVEKDFNFEFVSTMIPYPYCFLKDHEKYVIFLEKCACVAGTKLMAINVNGNAHGCVYEETTYGNVFEDGLKGAWKKFTAWHQGMIFPKECKDSCAYFDTCTAGCRIAAKTYDKTGGLDNLREGSDKITNPVPIKPTKEMYEMIEIEKLIVVPTIRIRKEEGFYYVNIFGAKGVIAENEVIDLLSKYKESGEEFTLGTVGEENREILAYALFYGLIETAEGREAEKERGNLKEF